MPCIRTLARPLFRKIGSSSNEIVMEFVYPDPKLSNFPLINFPKPSIVK
jgi:hypothetical protein